MVCMYVACRHRGADCELLIFVSRISIYYIHIEVETMQPLDSKDCPFIERIPTIYIGWLLMYRWQYINFS